MPNFTSRLVESSRKHKMLTCSVTTVLAGLLVSILYISLNGSENTEPQVRIKQGELRGTISVTRKGRSIYTFLGIPYAAPPVGKLRFQEPQAPISWSSVRDATSDGPICMQMSNSGVKGEEDCLYLNVHTPQMEGSALPVMVWIHGGGFFSGSGSSKRFPPTYLLDHDVVLVTFNYRLGILGFLSTGNEHLPGNYGMKDQVAALIWVHDNIAKFGGNPHCVTIVGASVGGSSVHYHMLSPLSHGLFHRAISQSGTATAPFASVSTSKAFRRTLKLASLVKCPTESASEMVNCLQVVNATDLVRTISEFEIWNGVPSISFAPVVEHSAMHRFLPETPLQLLNGNHSVIVPWLAGVNAQDGGLISEGIFADDTKIQRLDSEFNALMPQLLYMDVSQETINEIHAFYYKDGHITNASKDEVTNMFTDSYFLSPLNQSVSQHVQLGNKKVFMYYLTYVGGSSYSVLYGDKTNKHGVCHGDELLYLFPRETLIPNFIQTQNDVYMIDMITTLWTNFARTGDPTAQLSKLLPVKWDPVTTDTNNYLEIGIQLYRRTNLLPNVTNLWKKIMVNLLS